MSRKLRSPWGLQTAPNHIPYLSIYLSLNLKFHLGFLRTTGGLKPKLCYGNMVFPIDALETLRFEFHEIQDSGRSVKSLGCCHGGLYSYLHVPSFSKISSGTLAHDFQSLADTWVAACYLFFVHLGQFEWLQNASQYKIIQGWCSLMGPCFNPVHSLMEIPW